MKIEKAIKIEEAIKVAEVIRLVALIITVITVIIVSSIADLKIEKVRVKKIIKQELYERESK